MSKLAKDVGFEEIKEHPNEPHFNAGIKDGFLAKEPFGECVSLNVRCN